MVRSVVSVLAGAATWSVLWISSNLGLQAAFPAIVRPEERLEHVPMLLTFIVLSVVFSVGAGYVTAAVARRNEVGHAFALGVLQLALGIGFEVSYWDLLPVWYHLVFLALLIPGNVYGGMLRLRRRV